MARYSTHTKAGVAGMQTWVLSDAEARAEVELVPERGCLVTRWRVEGEELLFLDEATLADRSRNVRGGIPVLFPNAGPLPQDGYEVGGQRYSLPQHGLARTLPWEVASQGADARGAWVECRLGDSEETRARFPFAFALSIRVTLQEGRLGLTTRVRNPGTRPLPLHLGFHPYFLVPQAEKGATRVETDASRAFDNRSKQTGGVPPLDFTQEELDVHLLDHSAPGTVLHRGRLAPLSLAFSPEFGCLVLWTLAGRDFVCVEPWTAPGGALASGEGLLLVPAGEERTLRFEMARGA